MRRLAILFLVFSTISCDSNPASDSSLDFIQKRVNDARPFTYVGVYNLENPVIPGSDYVFIPGGTYPLNNAYAENGYLVVQSSSTHYFNLSNAKDIQIQPGRIDLYY